MEVVEIDCFLKLVPSHNPYMILLRSEIREKVTTDTVKTEQYSLELQILVIIRRKWIPHNL